MEPMMLIPIGTIYTPYRDSHGNPIKACQHDNADGYIEISEPYEAGLKDLEGFERIWIVYWFDRAQAARLRVTLCCDEQEHGIFATRIPPRPNPIGITCVKLLGIDGRMIHIEGADVLDGTPLLDIKPYIPHFDQYKINRYGWVGPHPDQATHTPVDSPDEKPPHAICWPKATSAT